jgi:hypothetical protein
MNIQAGRLLIACTTNVAKMQEKQLHDEVLSDLSKDVHTLQRVIEKLKAQGKMPAEKIAAYEEKARFLQAFITKKRTI